MVRGGKKPDVDISSFLWCLLNLWDLMKCVGNRKTLTFILLHFKIHQIPGGSRGLGLLTNIFIVYYLRMVRVCWVSTGKYKKVNNYFLPSTLVFENYSCSGTINYVERLLLV